MAEHNANTKTAQKTAASVANNAVTAQRIRAKLLARLEREIDALPDTIGTETHQTITDNQYSDVNDTNNIKTGGARVRMTKVKEGGKSYKLRDLTAAWKDLTGDLPRADSGEAAALERAREILGGVRSAID